MPDPEWVIRNGFVVRVNDGNDSNVQRELVVNAVRCYPRRFYNTAIPKDLAGFDAPVVLTVNPGSMTEVDFHKVDPIPPNLMFVRVRVCTWNLGLVDAAVAYYTKRDVPVILTFMAYFHKTIPEAEKGNYTFRKRTLNPYWAITTRAWEGVMARYKYNRLVYSCGKEGEHGGGGCRYCGNCLREYFATVVRMGKQNMGRVLSFQDAPGIV